MPEQENSDYSLQALHAIFALPSQQSQAIIEPVASGAVQAHLRDIGLGIFSQEISEPETDIPEWEFSEIAYGSF